MGGNINQLNIGQLNQPQDMLGTNHMEEFKNIS